MATPGAARPAAAKPTGRAVKAGARPKPKPPTKRRRRPADPARAWAKRLERTRPGLVRFTLDALAAMYGRPVWRRVHDPTSELVLTILSQNSADINAERAFDALCARWPSESAAAAAGAPDVGDPGEVATGTDAAPDARKPADGRVTRPGWGGHGVGAVPPPEWAAVEHVSTDDLIDVIRPGGLAPQKAPRIQASLRRVREERGDYSLEFLGELPAADALAWLTSIPGIGRKTASVVLLFSFGMPLMPVDRHVERVSKRVGLIPARADVLVAHDMFLALLEPNEVYQAHVNLITHGRLTCHARRPECHRCAVAPRCRYVDPKAP